MPKISIISIVPSIFIKDYFFKKNVVDRIHGIETGENEIVLKGIHIDGIEVEVFFYCQDYKLPNDNCHQVDGHPSNFDTVPNMYRTLFNYTRGEYICITDSLSLLKEGWLRDLLFYHESIKASGVVGIADSLENKTFSPLFNKEDEYTHVFVPNDCIVTGTCLFKRDILPLIAIVDENQILKDYSTENISLRASQILRLNNYYIPSQLSIKF